MYTVKPLVKGLLDLKENHFQIPTSRDWNDGKNVVNLFSILHHTHSSKHICMIFFFDNFCIEKSVTTLHTALFWTYLNLKDL